MKDEQLSFEFPRDDNEPSRRRYRRRRNKGAKQATGSARQPPQTALTTTPILQRCGFCGFKATVHGERTVCPECGGIITRPGDDQESVHDE